VGNRRDMVDAAYRRIFRYRLGIDQSGWGVFVQDRDLLIKRINEPYIVIVQKTYIFSAAGRQAKVARARDTSFAFDAHISDIQIRLTNLSSLIRRRVVNNHNFDIAS